MTTTPSLAEPRRWYRQLHGQIALGIVGGLVYGLLVRTIFAAPAAPVAQAGLDAAALVAQAAAHAQGQAETVAIWGRASLLFDFLGDLFIRALKMIIIPLIVSSVVCGIMSLRDTARLGRLGARAMAYYMGTTLVAVLIGLALVNAIGPGQGLALSFEAGQALRPTPLLDVFRQIIPPSVLGAFAKNEMLPSIFAAIVLGVALLSVGPVGRPLAAIFEAVEAVTLKITDGIMRTAPVGVAALFISTLLDPKLVDVGEFLKSLGGYSVTVVVGLGLHAGLALPLLLWVMTRRSPRAFAGALSAALLTAFSTASSSATYPVTLECVTQRAGVRRQSASFVLPLGATINMDGTALYEAVAAIFIANALGVELTLGQQIVVLLTATLAAIGAAGVPSAGLVTMIMVLESVGLPGAAYGLVVAVDRVLDQCRTTVNVWGDAVGAAIVDHWMPDEDASPQDDSPADDGAHDEPSSGSSAEA